jgi:hypothetical protein
MFSCEEARDDTLHFAITNCLRGIMSLLSLRQEFVLRTS